MTAAGGIRRTRSSAGARASLTTESSAAPDGPSPRAGLGRRLWPHEPLLVMADVDDFITAKPCDLFMVFVFFPSIS
jgi:hypothetical protein